MLTQCIYMNLHQPLTLLYYLCQALHGVGKKPARIIRPSACLSLNCQQQKAQPLKQPLAQKVQPLSQPLELENKQPLALQKAQPVALQKHIAAAL